MSDTLKESQVRDALYRAWEMMLSNDPNAFERAVRGLEAAIGDASPSGKAAIQALLTKLRSGMKGDAAAKAILQARKAVQEAKANQPSAFASLRLIKGFDTLSRDAQVFAEWLIHAPRPSWARGILEGPFDAERNEKAIEEMVNLDLLVVAPNGGLSFRGSSLTSPERFCEFRATMGVAIPKGGRPSQAQKLIEAMDAHRVSRQVGVDADRPQVAPEERAAANVGLLESGLDGRTAFRSLDEAHSRALAALNGQGLEEAEAPQLLGESGLRRIALARTNRAAPNAPVALGKAVLHLAWQRLSEGHYQVVAFME